MQSPGWYAQRLRAMSAREIAFRVRRAAAIGLGRIAPVRLPVKLYDEGIPGLPGLDVPQVESGPYAAKADRLLSGRMDVFACRDYCLGAQPDWNKDPKTGVAAPLSFGKGIDYRDEGVVGNIKYLWEPSRHLKLPVLAQAYRLTGDRKYLRRLVDLLESWMQQCPYPKGVHWCSSLEVAIRLINWSLVWRIVGGTDAWNAAGAGDDFLARWRSSIFRHMQFIDGYYSAYSSANNHLIGEAAGVYIGAVTWPGWDECAQWRGRARDLLLREIVAQTHPDGVNAEQAISYQQFVLDFFILSGLAGMQADDPFPTAYWDSVERMLEFVASLMDVNGNVPMIGDADDGYVTDMGAEKHFSNFRSLLATGAIFFNRADFAAKAGSVDSKTRWLISDAERRFSHITEGGGRPPLKRAFPDGGYFVLGADLESPEELRVVFDAGPLGMGPLAAHGHADALAFTLSVGGIPMIVDPGTYAYHTDKIWRDYFRGTSAHNTLRVDRQDQSKIGGNFMWSRHARAVVTEMALDGAEPFVSAWHDGYHALADPVTHSRLLRLDTRTRTLEVRDELDCNSLHFIELFFHFPEYVTLRQNADGVSLAVDGRSVTVSAAPGLSVECFQGNESVPLGWISYSFDHKLPSCTLRHSGTIEGRTVLVTRIGIRM